MSQTIIDIILSCEKTAQDKVKPFVVVHVSVGRISFSTSFLHDDFRVTDIFFNGTPYFVIVYIDTFSYPLYKSIEVHARLLSLRNNLRNNSLKL